MGTVTTTPEELMRRLDVEIKRASLSLHAEIDAMACDAGTPHFLASLTRYEKAKKRRDDLETARRIMEEFGVIG